MKRLFFGIVCMLLIMATSRTPQAVVTGVCYNCHTMHSSQGVAPSMWTAKGWSQGTTRECLLVGSCVGCHAQNPSGANIVTGIPQVRHGGTDLAAGNFNYIAGTDDDKGHNVAAIDQEGNGSMFPPPGYETDPGITAANFTCAGAYGCHGNRTESNEIASLKGSHHTIDSVLKFGSIIEDDQGGSVGLSYRFLMGVKGGEEANWMGVSPDEDTHNEYKGATSPGTSSRTSPANNTISGLCAECHGYYHGSGTDETGGTASPWKRHPSDIVLPNGGEYAEYNTPNTGTTQYSLTVPLARQVIPTDAASGEITLGTDVVMCLSCHQAHASNYYKLMRWDYASATLLSATPVPTDALYGCVVCHTSKS